MLKIDAEPESTNEGAHLRIGGTGIAKRAGMFHGIAKRGGVFKVDDDVASPNSKRGGLFKIYDEPESPNEGACLRYMLNRNRPMRERVASPNEGGV